MMTEPVPFKTTYGFSADASYSSGAVKIQDVPMHQKPPLAILPRPPPVQLPPTIAALSASPTLVSGRTRQESGAWQLEGTFKPIASSAPTGPRLLDNLNVGWKGLLEASRNSGHSGIIRPALVGGSSDEADIKEAAKVKACVPIVEVCATLHPNASIRRLVKSVSRGLTAEQEPEAAQEGMGGTYFMSNENGRKVAILKPCDEEPLAPNNPKGYVGRQLGDPGWKPTVRVGEAAMREVAAYILDKGFAMVPTSVLVRARHPIFCYNTHTANVVKASTNDLQAMIDDEPMPMKLGSLQEFVVHECDTSEMGSSKFSVSDVHRIGILDIRLFNTDRHAGNMLVRSKVSTDDLPRTLATTQYELIPIDHGFCLPETLESAFFEWLHWPQALLPFSSEELDYIRNLDIAADKALLATELPHLRPECVRVLELSTMLLKRLAEAGYSLFEIGSLLSRPFVGGDEEPSDLEKISDEARRSFMEGIAEGDESEEESDDLGEEEEELDVNQDDDDDIGTVPLNFASLTVNAPKPVSNSYESSKDDDAMMFDMEVGADRTPAFSPLAYPHQHGLSPSQYSVSSVSSSSPFSYPHQPSFGNENRQAARSVSNTSFLWRSSMKTSRKKRSPQAYPPPILHGKSHCVGSDGVPVISFSDFSELQWQRFMLQFEILLSHGIKEGSWRQVNDSPGGGIAMSCPRF